MKNELIKMIERNDKVVIFRHVKPDPDALGSQNGLASLLKTLYPEKTILKAGSTVKNLAWLGEMDEDVSADGALAIILDTANLERIDGNYQGAKEIIKLDHHPLQDKFGDLEIIKTSRSSTAEILIDLFKAELKQAKLETINALYAGLVGDTGRFMYGNTSQQTLELAGYLVGLGAQGYLMGYAYTHMQYLNEQTVSLVIPYSYLVDNHMDVSDTYVATGALQRLEDGKLVLVAIGNEDGSYRVHLPELGENAPTSISGG
ncbi:DHH family phosphoesterase [Ligilactobacillus agilis]|nr:DHH family phosphoesterase [Ligilactobacillus agilis]